MPKPDTLIHVHARRFTSHEPGPAILIAHLLSKGVKREFCGHMSFEVNKKNQGLLKKLLKSPALQWPVAKIEETPYLIKQ